MGEAIIVGTGEMKFTHGQHDVLIASGLGSCIGICAYEPDARVAGMAIVVLPDSGGSACIAGKFADTAVPALLEHLIKHGAAASRIRIALAGGAQLLDYHGAGLRFDTGMRNTHAVHAALEKASLCVSATDLGGSAERALQMTGDGRVQVKVFGKPERELANLGTRSLTPTGASVGHVGTIIRPIVPGLDAIRRV